MLAGVLFAGAQRTPIPAGVCTLVRSYEAVKNTNAPMGFWERLVYSFELSRQQAAGQQQRPAARAAISSASTV